jgi:predicted TIM-barrel fold metal-dependent hydrolase
MASTVGIERMVIVQASIYGTDNSCLLDSIAVFGQHRARGIAVVDASVTHAQLADMHASGVRGIRFNAITGVTPLEWLPKIAEMIAPLGWHIQLWIKADRLLQIADVVRALPVDVVLDHMAQVPIERGLNDPQVACALKLMESEHCWMKLVGYRISKMPYPHQDVDTFAQQVINIVRDPRRVRTRTRPRARPKTAAAKKARTLNSQPPNLRTIPNRAGGGGTLSPLARTRS